MPGPAHLRAITATIASAQTEVARSPLAGELLVLVNLDDPARAYVVHRDGAIELTVHPDDILGVDDLRTTVARTAIGEIIAERATWRGRLADALDALRGER